jgi:glycosyltransferase involved in cell wall biosynthesis
MGHRSLTVALATSYLQPDWRGGINTYVHGLARALSERGHRVCVVGPGRVGCLSDEYLAGYRVVRFPLRSKRWALRNPETLMRFPEAAARIQADHSVDAWMSMDLFTGLALRRWLRVHPTPWTAVCHSLTSVETYTENIARRPRSAIVLGAYCRALRSLERRLYSQADKVLVLSEYTKKEIQNRLGVEREVLAIPGGVDLQRFSPASPERRREIRVRLRIPVRHSFLFTARRLEHRMGLPMLVEAIRILNARSVKVFCVIGGEGTLRATLERGIQEHCLSDVIRLEGFIPDASLADYYRAADISILPSVELEGFGLTILEAFASGCPMIGTPVGNIPFLIAPIAPSLVSRDVTSDSLAETIQQAIQGQDAHVRADVRTYVERDFSWPDVAQKIEAQLMDTVTKTPETNGALAYEV